MILSNIAPSGIFGKPAVVLGLGLVSGNWLSLSVLVVFPVAATAYRIQIEETALTLHFGKSYREYANRTKRLLPGIY